MMLTTAMTTRGAVRGQAEGGVVVFRGVPYASCARFSRPEPTTAWEGERDATTDGPIAPQWPSRMDSMLGIHGYHEQSEDCLYLTITTPTVDGPVRPVIVWLHGGGWVSGAGSLKCYGGHRLANEGNVVVVSVNYRLGMLGYLRSPGVSDGNLGLADQLAALRWVRDNIAAFGGDPDAVTVAGQSAGAHSVQCLIGMPESRGLFHRAIIQSSPAGLGLGSARTANRSGARFLALLGASPTTAPLSAVLDAQAEVGRLSGRGFGLGLSTGVTPVPGIPPMPSKALWSAEVTKRAPSLDILMGSTAREAAAFFAQHPNMLRLRRIPVLGPTVAAGIEQAISSVVFTRPIRRLAQRLSRAGARVWAYRIDYAAPATLFGAAHGIELPFLLGADSDWVGAEMLAGADPKDVESLGRRLRAAWLSFIHTGDPNTDGDWSRFTARSPTLRHWDA